MLAPRFDASDRELLAHPETAHEDEVKLPGPNGAPRFVLTHKAVFRDAAGTPAGIVGADLDITEIRHAEQALRESTVQLRLTLKAAVAALGQTTEMRDPYTAGHQRRVALLADAIATELAWDEQRIEALHTAALLHDLGKIVIPAEILAKPGRLSENEMNLIRQHPVAGAETVASIDFEGAITEMVRQHHERLDGSGYPAGLKDGEILPEARILAVADVVEAMSSHRPYRPALSTRGGPLRDRGRRRDALRRRGGSRLLAPLPGEGVQAERVGISGEELDSRAAEMPTRRRRTAKHR